MKKAFVFALMFLALPLPASAQRAPSGPERATTIAAVVNDNVITTTDLEQRLRLAILSSGLPDNMEVRTQLLPQILRSLIDEQLQAQEAKKLDLVVSDAELRDTLDRIGRDNGIPGDILAFVSSRGVSPEAMRSQVRNGLLWNKVIQRELRPKVDIGEDEIDAAIERVRADAGKEEYLVSEILLTVDNAKDEDAVKAAADRLVAQIRGGASFAAVARQFSQGTGAAQGGDIGWIQQGQLAPELNRALQTAGIGQVSTPIRTASGYHILGIRDKRTVTLGDPAKASVNLVQAFRPGTTAETADSLREAAKLRASVKACAALDQTIAKFPGWSLHRLGDMTLAKAPDWLANRVRNVPTNSSSEPLNTDKGVVVLFVCGRNDVNSIDRDVVMRSIGTEKLELQSRRLMRDLRRGAYIDIRIGKKP